MKKIKKIVSLMLAVVMVLGMSVTAFAAEGDVTISAPEGSTRTYEVYQIFTGDLAADKTTLSNVKYGQNAKLTGDTKVGDAVPQSVLDELAAVNSKSDTEKLAVIEKYADLTGTSKGTVSAGKSLDVPTGYYLIKDNGPVGDGESYSLYVVQIVGPITIEPKVGTTTSDKKVDDKNDSNTSEDTATWQDSADYDIGDAVPFKLSATIASDYANYTNGYKLTFHDVESTGLVFNADSVVVKVDGTKIETGYEVVTTGLTDGCTFEVRFSNLKDITSVKAGSVITVEYTSTLNKNAVIGSKGNPNTSHVTYTNNPNDDQAGENGKTKDDTVIVFTYKVVVNKFDQDKKPLEDAGFTLYKYDVDDTTTEDKWVAVGDEIKGDEMTTFTWSGLDDGKYKLVETTTPDGYNTIDSIEFTITAEHTVESDNPALTSLTVDNTSFTVEMTEGSATPTGNISTDVVNQKGSTLPETGGMGTTIFYIVGALLVIGAAVVLIARKRMSAER